MSVGSWDRGSGAISLHIVSSLFQCHFPAVIAEGMALPQRILFPLEKICMEWQQQRRAGAGLHSLGNTCFLNPPLLLGAQHSCCQQGFCMMCRTEERVNKVLQSSGSAIQPWAVVRIRRHFEPGMQGDAHEFLRCAADAMQRACLSGSSE
uniref:Uncharacterized protein n=1 Tax=Bubo bubo TaxID=30461 RepID=A0A8C0F5F4_BUBBB